MYTIAHTFLISSSYIKCMHGKVNIYEIKILIIPFNSTIDEQIIFIAFTIRANEYITHHATPIK